MPTMHTRFMLIVFATLVSSGCVRSEPREAPGEPRATGSIEGRILHSEALVPALRICAIGSGAPEQAKHICVRTQAHRTAYRIERVPAGDYVIVAQADNGPIASRFGGHMQQVQCIRAPCPSVPATVTVGENVRVQGIDLNEFFAEREGLPALPPE